LLFFFGLPRPLDIESPEKSPRRGTKQPEGTGLCEFSVLFN
jgi:hypothetical protein